VGGNILMFVPLGAYIPLIIKKFGSFSRTVILAILASFMIETTQGIISLIIQYGYRSVDIDDIILNTIGASIGYMFFKFAISPVLLKNPWLMNKEASFSTFDPL
jgi:glycopeptide antibiotics resistance protein